MHDQSRAELSLTHYREAVRIFHVCGRIENAHIPALMVDAVEKELREVGLIKAAAGATAIKG